MWWQCRQKWTAWGLAGAFGLISAGCHFLPVRHVDPTLDPRRLSSTTDRENVTSAPNGPEASIVRPESVPLPPLPLEPVSDAEALASKGGQTKTPLLDAALIRAQALQNELVDPSNTPPKATFDEDAAQPPGTMPPLDPPPPPLEMHDPPQAQAPDRVDAGPDRSSPTKTAPPPPPGPPPSPPEAPPTDDEPQTKGPTPRVPQLEPVQPVWEPRSPLFRGTGEEGPTDCPEEKDATLWHSVIFHLADRSETNSTHSTGDREASRPDSLEIADLRLCHKISGFGRFEPLDSEKVQADQTVLLYCEMSGVRYEPSGNQQVHSRIASRLEIIPSTSDEPAWGLELGVAKDVCGHSRRDYYVNYRIALPGPEKLHPGPYRLRLVQKDLLSGQEAKRDIRFCIVAE